MCQLPQFSYFYWYHPIEAHIIYIEGIHGKNCELVKHADTKSKSRVAIPMTKWKFVKLTEIEVLQISQIMNCITGNCAGTKISICKRRFSWNNNN